MARLSNSRARASRRRALALAAALIVLAAPASAAAPPVSWYSIVTGAGAHVGYIRVEVRQTGDGLERTEQQEVTVREQDARATRLSQRTTLRQDRAGRALSLTTETRTGASVTRTEARPRPGGVEVMRETPAGRTRVILAAGPDVQFDGGEALLARWDPAAGSRLEFEAFNPDTAAVERIVVSVLPGAAPAGGLTLLRAAYDGAELRGVSRLSLDAGRRVTAVTQPMFGTTISVLPTDEATALRPRAPLRLMTTLMTKAPFRIPAGAIEGHIRYRFGFRDGLRFDLPQTGEQRVRLVDGAAVVDVCAACGPGLPSDAAALAAARAPTAWLQSDDPRIRAVVAPIAALKVSDARKMEMLTDKARGYIGEIDFAGHYSAAEIMQRRRGDCTEAAVLVAAFGRAAGIPTRTASGWVYSRERYHGVSNVFMPHSWAMAYVDGRWVSYDAALPRVGATHIAVTIGDGDLRSMAASGQLASLLTWEAMTEVRRRPAS